MLHAKIIRLISSKIVWGFFACKCVCMYYLVELTQGQDVVGLC